MPVLPLVVISLLAQAGTPHPGFLADRSGSHRAVRTSDFSHRPRPAASGAPTTTTISASANPALYGQPVTLSALVSPAGASGSVTFYDGTAVLGSAPLAGGQASLTTAILPFGANAVAARYSGDSNDAPSISSELGVAVAVPPESGLGAVSTFPTGSGPIAVVVADFNGDGLADLATANSGSNNVSVLLGVGNGSFQVPVNTASGNNPSALAAADFNGDGKIDLAVANSADDTVSILLGNGDGTFQAAVSYPVGSDPDAIAIGDFNGDGWADIAVANFNDGTVSVLLGNGDGTFGSESLFSVGSGPAALVIADFNADGNADLAVANSGDDTVGVLLGDGQGAFAAAQVSAVGLNPSGMVAGDFNGDGKMDLAVADFGDYVTLAGGDVEVLPGNGDGTFQGPVSSPAGTSPWVLAAGDLNGDGTLDLAVSGDSGINVLLGNGDGSFVAPVFYSTGSTPIGLALGPFDGTGLTDVAVAAFEDNDVAILLSKPGTCLFGLAPPTFLFDASGGTANLTLTSNSPACSWSTSGDSWIVPASASGVGGAQVAITVETNSSGVARQGTIAIGGQSVTVSQLATTQMFQDVPPQAYYFDAVNMLKGQGITSGCTSTDYCPAERITRAQMAIFAVRSVYGSNSFTASSQPYFSDVPPGAFGFQWIQKMYELGITTGCGGGRYCPSASVTRAQMAIFIIRTRFGAQAAFTFPNVPYFSDVPANAFGFDWIQRMKLESITSGCGTTTYCPNGSVTRGDMAVFLMRGAFNELLPAGTPVITSISPSTLARGGSGTYTVTGLDTSFVDGQTTLSPMPGVTIGTIAVTASNAFTVQLAADAAAVPQPVSMVAITGSEQAVLPNGLVIQ